MGGSRGAPWRAMSAPRAGWTASRGAALPRNAERAQRRRWLKAGDASAKEHAGGAPRDAEVTG